MQPGTVVASRYEVRRFLGRGGMGDVYLAFDRELDETVALKLLRPELSESADMDARFRIDTSQGSVAVAASLIPNAHLLPRLTATPRSASVSAAR